MKKKLESFNLTNRKSKSLPEEEEMIVNTMPKKLDAVFAEITSTSGKDKF